MEPPCPPLPHTLTLPPVGEEPNLRPLPSGPGVFAFEDEAGRTISLVVTANVRRLARSRLAPAPEASAGPRRVDYRSVTHRVRSLRVGSAFEAEWAYLQLARRRLPSVFTTLVDRWRAWFIHCDVEETFPRFTTVRTPPDTGCVLGPVPDKSAAQTAIETLEEIFDLCRYYRILCEAPHGRACAYKEMGKCAAPCDGTVGMDVYRDSIRAALAFLEHPRAGHDELEAGVRAASTALEFERAGREQRRVEASRALLDARYAYTDRLDRFRFVGVMPSEAPGWARLFVIVRGWIEPWADLSCAIDVDALASVTAAIDARMDHLTPVAQRVTPDNIGLVCRALFQAPLEKGMLLHCPDGLAPKALSAALARLDTTADNTAAGDDVPESHLDAPA